MMLLLLTKRSWRLYILMSIILKITIVRRVVAIYKLWSRTWRLATPRRVDSRVWTLMWVVLVVSLTGMRIMLMVSLTLRLLVVPVVKIG